MGALAVISVTIGVFVLMYLFFRFKAINWVMFQPSQQMKLVSVPHQAVHFGELGELHGWSVNCTEPSNKVILLCHGNAGNISDRESKLEDLRKMANVFIFDYSGYGKSKGSPSESQVCLDGQKAYDYIRKKYDSKDVYIYGVSLGGAVAVDIASKNPCGGLILQSTFCGTDDFAPTSLKPFCSWFQSGSKMGDIKCPVIILHSVEDEIVPFAAGKKLYGLCTGSKRFFIIKGSHNYPVISQDQHEKLKKFVKNEKAHPN